MKAQSAQLQALLATGYFVSADLWTITLSGGAVIRWTSHDQPISYGGNTFTIGPVIDRGTITAKKGVEVATLDVTITGTATDLINGTAIIPFIAKHGLDGASIKLESAYAADWSSPVAGTMIDFAGRVTSIHSIQGAIANLTISSWMVLLNNSAPRNLYQGGCLRTLYDAGCAVVANAYSANGIISAAGTVSFSTNLAGAAGYYAQGRIVFSSGANAGLSRTVKGNATGGVVSLVWALPAPVASGDTFTIYAGCDLSNATCSSKFNNLLRFKGQPFVPVPTTALGATTTTTTGGK
jgi:uncharacterized phage protein (TIGR02218 family)